MKTALVILLGNRDIQIYKNKFEELKAKYSNYFIKNNDDDDFYIIDKFNSNKHNESFLKISNIIWEEYDYFKDFISFELFQKTINILKGSNKHIDKIFITTSKQDSLDKQDCYYVALCLEKYLNDSKISNELKLCEKNPTNFEDMFQFYTYLFSELSNDYQKIFISNSGGTPQMRTASHFAGLFQGYEYIAVSSTDINVTKTYQQQENLILSKIILKMLDVYDYEGILKLPISQNIKDKCQEALDWYNLNTNLIESLANYEPQSIKAIEFIVNNMLVCFAQGRYADVIGRIFRIEECLWQIYLYEFLKMQGVVQVENYCQITENASNLQKHYKDEVLASKSLLSKIIKESFKDISKDDSLFNKGISIGGKGMYYFIFKSINFHVDSLSFFERLNNNYEKDDNPLSELRNHSILGHGFKGVSKQDIEDIVGNFQTFSNDLISLIESELDFNTERIFDQINQKIKELL